MLRWSFSPSASLPQGGLLRSGLGALLGHRAGRGCRVGHAIDHGHAAGSWFAHVRTALY